MNKNFFYKFDIDKNELVSDCKINPTDINQSVTHWLYAGNNKYDDVCDHEKIGKWMLFVNKDHINPVWDKIKMAITSGDLWHTKVSTTTDEPGKTSHAIMIYTPDYSDLNDVIRVLNYLESSGIKSPQTIIKYKTDQQTRAGVYRGGRQKPWIYSSDTIRGRASDVPVTKPLSWRDR